VRSKGVAYFGHIMRGEGMEKASTGNEGEEEEEGQTQMN